MSKPRKRRQHSEAFLKRRATRGHWYAAQENMEDYFVNMLKFHAAVSNEPEVKAAYQIVLTDIEG